MALPSDPAKLIDVVAASLKHDLASAAFGMLVVDTQGVVVWINEAYRQFLPRLGFTDESQFVGRTVEQAVPNSMMRRVVETGQAIPFDLLTNKAGTFVVSRVPVRDNAGAVLGALGIVVFDAPETALAPLIAKFGHVQRELDDARRELAQKRRTKYTFASFIGLGEAASAVKRQARRAAQTESPVLLLGETGTGKELLAHAIHAASARAAQAFVSVNIAAVPETLLEAEFFGVAPGAYTGADRKARDGKFKLADRGTLFLDEIGDMPITLQAKLLRVLQEQEVEPLGSNQLIPVNVRVIAATSRDLSQMVQSGSFRADLYYRLNVLPVRVPPLRERLDDLPQLIEGLLDDIAARSGVSASGLPVREIAPEAQALLAAQPWPGNIRELRNVLEQAVLGAESHRLERADFVSLVTHPNAPMTAQQLPNKPAWSPQSDALASLNTEVMSLAERVAQVERDAINEVMRRTGGNKAETAKLLKMSRGALYAKLAAYGVESHNP
jgi:transcriptional regulator with PAS, ATPase and Fis domain